MHRRPAAIVLLALATSVAGATPASAADAMSGSWLGNAGQIRNRLHTISETDGSLTIRAAETYSFPESPACTMPAGTVLGVFHFVGTATATDRRYEGAFFSWESSGGSCTIKPAAGQWTAALTSGGDGFQRPPLPEGPNNVLDVYPGLYGTRPLPGSGDGFAFVRKGGTAAPTPTTAPARTTVPRTGSPSTTAPRATTTAPAKPGAVLVNCNGRSQRCSNAYSKTVQTAKGNLVVRFTTSSGHCSAVRITISVDGRTPRSSPFIGASASTPAFSFPVAAGRHVIRVSAEGRPGGCNQGYLARWAGTLRVTPPSASPAGGPITPATSA